MMTRDQLIEIEETRCVCCSRPTYESDDPRNPLRRCWQGGGSMYVLCARCESVAKAEAGAV